MKYTRFLFDLDGTLVDTGEGVFKCCAYALAHFGIRFEDTAPAQSYLGPPLLYSFTKFAHLSEADARKAIDLYRERYDEKGIYECKVPEEIPEILRELSGRGALLAVATSKLESAAQRLLSIVGLDGFFPVISGSDPEETVCTKEQIIEQTLARMGCKSKDGGDRKDVLMIGDRKYDVLGARQCGLDSLGVYTGSAEAGELESAGATYVAASMAEAKALLLQ